MVGECLGGSRTSVMSGHTACATSSHPQRNDSVDINGPALQVSSRHDRRRALLHAVIEAAP